MSSLNTRLSWETGWCNSYFFSFDISFITNNFTNFTNFTGCYLPPPALVAAAKAGRNILSKLTINVPVVYLARDVMILMRANPLQGPLELEILRAHPFQWPEQWIFPNQNHLVHERHIKNRYIGNFMYLSCHFITQKSLNSQPPPLSNGICNGFASH
jgi:hypothetical protein